MVRDGEAHGRQATKGAVFLDRDGVLNANCGYVGDIARFRWIEGVRETIVRINAAGLFVFVVSNQSGVARGFYEEADVEVVHAHMSAELSRIGAWIDDFRYCPHLPEAVKPAYRTICGCRKPEPGMILDLMSRWLVDPRRSIMIGDNEHDAQAGRAAGIEGRLLGPGERLGDVIEAFLAALPPAA